MIKVNLQHRKAAVGVAAGTGEGAKGFSGFGGLLEKLRGGDFGDSDKRSAIIVGIVYAVIIGGGWWIVGEREAEMLAKVDAESSAVDSKLNLLSSELNKTSGYEQIKKSLEADEKTIRTKIDTIQELIRDRSTPPKILTTLSETIPKEVWLQEFSLKDQHFKIRGNSTSMDVISDFIKGLEETIYFKNVVLKSSKQETPKGGHSTASFELEADRR
jgi:hypothetical protein